MDLNWLRNRTGIVLFIIFFFFFLISIFKKKDQVEKTDGRGIGAVGRSG
jgi:hypothetical protein